MKGLFSGRQIRLLASKGDKVTRSQTATNAIKAITAKYGSLKDEEKYFHLGKGNWRKYSLSNDKKRTGKLAQSKEEWRQQPHKLDFQGIDTKDGVSGKKPRFSVTSLKPSAKLAGRKGKSQVKATSKAILKNVVKPKPIKAKHKEQVKHDNVEWDVFAQKLVVKKKPDKSLVRIPCKSERDAYIKGRELENKGITNIEYKLLGGVWTVEYKRQKSTIRANHVYASFMRPLWIGFNPGVQYREIKVTDAHKDFRFNRKPHAVIVTSQPIPEDKIKSLELTDLIKGKKLAKEVKRIKGLSFLDDNMKESLISQVLAGKDKAVINKYIEKGKQLAEKKQKKQKFSMTSLKGSDKPTARKVMALGKLNGIPVNRMQRARKVIKGGFNFRTGFTWITNGNTYKITSITGTAGNKNIKYVNMKNPNKTYVTNEKDLTFDLRLNKNVREINKKQAEDNAKWAKVEAEQKKKEEAEYQKQLEGLEGFETTLSKMNKPRAIELFNGFIRTNGKIKTRKDMIRDLIKAGYIVGKDKKGKTQLVKDSSVYDNLTKTEYNFAEYLIKKWKIKPKLSLSALKGPAKLAGRKDKLQPKLNNKAVTKSAPKPTKQAKIESNKDKQKINTISKDVWIRHKNAEARSAGLNVDPAEVTKVLNNLVKNAKISRSGNTIKVESAYPEYAHKAVRIALNSGYNDTSRLGVVKTISNKILYKGVTIVISANKGLKVKPLMGEFKNYKYKITPETGTIEYILNGGRLKGYEDKFNINLEAMEDLKIKAMKEIEDHIKSSNTFAHAPAKIMKSKPVKKSKKATYNKPKKELSSEEQLKRQVKEEASADWNNQCKMFMSGKIPFRDKTARACYDRHAKAAGL